MSIVDIPRPDSAAICPPEARRHRWTRDDYHRIADTGVLADKRVELLGGDILEMSPPKEQHVVAVENVVAVLRRLFGSDYWVRTQAPLSMPDDSEPVPDVAVVPGPRGKYSERNHPSMALLIVEVSDSTLSIDRGVKADLYASAEIADYWVLNLPQRRLEVHRKPIADPAHPHGYRYGELRTLGAEESIVPLAAPGKSIRVADVLP